MINGCKIISYSAVENVVAEILKVGGGGGYDGDDESVQAMVVEGG